MKKINQATIIYTILHFFVDFTTIFFISNILLGPKIAIANHSFVIITYNLVAFAGQLPIGIAADIINKNHFFASLGCFLAGLAYPVALISPWASCIMASLGNAAFHIGAGAQVLKESMPKAGPAGLFVSSGALGVWLAYKASDGIIAYICPVIMFIAAILIIIRISEKEDSVPLSISFKKPTLAVLLAVSCFLLTIVIRSLLGMAMNFSWKAEPWLSLAFILAVVFGKALGGFLADSFGAVKTAAASLSLALALFVFSFDYWAFGIIAAMCFNMTMPLTLTAISQVCGEKYGFSFGLTTFALAAGFIPTVFGASSRFGLPMLIGGVFASLLFIISGYLILKKKRAASPTSRPNQD